MKKSNLEREVGIAHYALSKLSQEKDVSTEVLSKICAALGCIIDGIMEFIPENDGVIINASVSTPAIDILL